MAEAPTALFGEDVSHGARLLAVYLWSLTHVDKNAAVAPFVAPTIAAMSRTLSQARSTTRKHLAELETQGLIRADTGDVFGRQEAGWTLARKTLHGWSVCSAFDTPYEEERATHGVVSTTQANRSLEKGGRDG